MKKIKISIILIMSIFILPTLVKADTCPKINADLITNNASYFNAADYANVDYCKAGQSMQSRGCFALSMATIVDTYYNNTSPATMGSSICNSSSYNNDLSYGSILADSSFQNSQKIKIQKLSGNINSINTALENNTMILASIKGGIFHHTNSIGHYIVLAFKDEFGYYVLNTGYRADNGYYSETDIVNNVVNKINKGLYQVSPTDCSGSGSNSGSSGNVGGTTSDPYPEYEYPDFGGGKTDCTNIFKKANGELNDFGEFVQSIFTLMKVMAPVLVIVLSTIDYVKAIASSNAEEVKKANGRTIKRIIIGVLIFFLPFILDILFHLFGLYDLSRCDIG